MAQNQSVTGISSVPDPGGLRYPVNSISAIGTMGGQSAPGAPSGGVQRSGPTLPVNSPQAQSVGVPGPWAAPGSGGPGGVSSVADPGNPRFAVGQTQTVSYPADQATPGGGDPGATGGYVPGPTQGGAQWSQFNISGNPNPGALSGSGGLAAPTYLPGQTAPNQINPNANPNPGGL